MQYISTRGEAPKLGFDDVLLAGLANDGGLYVPESWPQVDAETMRSWRGLSYPELAVEVMLPFVEKSIPREDFATLVQRAYATFQHSAVTPVKQLDTNVYLLELFHGPTLAFKDCALQLLGHLFDYVLERRNERVTIVGATSGDTGSAAIEAIKGRKRADIFILFPEGRVSPVQQRQMTTVNAENVHALAVEGTFDDCQDLVKAMFADADFRGEVSLSAVNSINWARVLAQAVYYFSSAVALGAPARQVSFTVPTGNFGDIFAGFIAKRMGLPIDKLIVATNQNDILHRCLTQGAYKTSGVLPSISPSMDIQVSSNFERLLFEAYGRDGAAVSGLMAALKAEGGFSLSQGVLEMLQRDFQSGRCSEEQTRAQIEQTLKGSGELLCPHSAIGVHVAEQQIQPETPMITLATAHPAKFPDAVQSATGLRPDLPPHMADLFERPERIARVANDLGALKQFIKERISL